MKKRTPVPLGAVAATHRPGFKARPSAMNSWIFYILPLSPLINEAIATHQLRLRCPETVPLTLPDRGGTEEEVYVVSKTEVDLVLNSQFRDYRIYYQRTEDGPLYVYRAPENRIAKKDKAAKDAFRRTRV